MKVLSALRAAVIVGYFLLATLPIGWLVLTSAKTHGDTISANARFIPWPSPQPGNGSPQFTPTLDAYRHLSKPVAGTPLDFYHYLWNSVLIGVVSTVAAVCLGTFAAYGFSRFRIAGARDWLFFILSTRFLPPLAVVVPVLAMYRSFALENTHVGLIVL
jgi:multiple sugar transport system permease protein